MISRIIFCTLFTVSLAGRIRSKPDNSALRGIGKRQLDCTLYFTETQRQNDAKAEEEWICLDKNGDFLDLNIQFDEDYKYPGVGVLESGGTVLRADDVYVSDKKAIIRGQQHLSKKPIEHRRKLISNGVRSVLVVRIEANDSSTSASETEVAKKVFGIGDEDSFNLSSGYDQCSYGQLKLKAAEHYKVQNGVYTLRVNKNIKEKKNTDVRNDALQQLRAELGIAILENVFDHVMIIIPPGTKSKHGNTDWAAYAIVNGYITMFNDNWGLSTSTQIHEIGHNLGLKHSNQNGEYLDISGMMGHSFLAQNRPRMCFNPAKSWQLNWYEERQTTVKPLETNFWDGTLIGITDYENDAAPNGSSVIIKIEGHNKDYFVGFNRRSGINAENQEFDAANKVTIHSIDSFEAPSELEAKLSIGESFEIENFGGFEQSVLVHVQYIDMIAEPAVAKVSIDYMRCTSDSECNDSSSCTTDTCNLSTGSCVHAPNDQCAGFMEMILLTDRYPTETSWTIVDNCDNDKIVMSGGNYQGQSTNYVETANVPNSKYTMKILDAYGDGVCCSEGAGSYHLKYNDNMIAEGGDFGRMKTHTWGSCDTPAPTPTPTPSPTVTPTASPTSCEMSYELSFNAGTSGDNNDALSYWEFAYDQDLSIIESISTSIYQSGSSYTEVGCLPSNCYRFIIRDAESYILKVDGREVANGEAVDEDEISLFGTCEPIRN